MHKLNRKPDFVDKRGEITDLIVDDIDSITKISFEVDAIRGNHFHKETTQWTYVISGELIIGTLKDGKLDEVKVTSDDFFVSLPGEPHAMKALKRSEILIFTKGPRSGMSYHDDTYAIEVIK